MTLWRKSRANVLAVLSSSASNTSVSWDISTLSISKARLSGTAECSDHQESNAQNVRAREQ